MVKVVSFKNQTVPVYLQNDKIQNIELLNNKLYELELDFNFRKQWKKIKSVEMIRDIAILQYSDGTKLYLEVS